MAKATAPLFSLGATGAFAKTLVFDRRGYVRKYVIPANPKTSAQADIRIPFAGVAAVIKAVGDTCKTDIKAALESQGKTAYRWNAEIISAALENDYWDTKAAAFNNLSTTDKDAWQTNAQAKNINPQAVTYGTTPDHYAGLSMFVVASALHEKLGLGTQEPTGTNADYWANYIAS